MYYLLKIQVGLHCTIREFPYSAKEDFLCLGYDDSASQHENGLFAQENCYTIRQALIVIHSAGPNFNFLELPLHVCKNIYA